MLALNPGKLTRDYVHGHRQRYIAPLALFLLTIFLMFFVFGVTGSGDSIRFGGPGANVVTVADANQMLARIDRDVAAVRAKPQSPAAAAEELKPLLLLRDAVSARRARLARGEKPGFFDGLTDSVAAADKLGMVHVKPGDNALAAASRRALANPELFVDRLQQKGYKFAFLLVPLSLPWMWLAFARRRDVRLYDHVVFLLYGLSFMALLVVAAHLADLAGAGGAALSAVALIFPVHLYRQLRGAYRLSVGGALWRTGFLALSAGFTLVMYLVLVVAIGLLD